jgi:iron complex outermembrane receptor protein
VQDDAARAFTDSLGYTDTLRVTLGEVYIEAARLPIKWREQPVSISLIDSTALSASNAQNLGDALRFHSPALLRSYGLGGVQSVSSRGFGPRQTQLVWNGFSLNHAMLGQTDYALVPAALTGNLRVASGNSSASFGDGGAAGSVLFDSPEAENRTRVSYQQGAWGMQGISLKTGYKQPNHYLSLSLSGRQATNDYPYFDDIRSREERRRNNEFRNRHLMLSGGLKAGPLSYDSSLWLGAAQHHIAGSSTNRNPQAVQDDAFLRWSHHLRFNHAKTGFWQLSGLYDTYELDYLDLPLVDSRSRLVRRMIRLTHRIAPAEQLFISSGLDAGFLSVETNNYDGLRRRQTYSAFTHLEYRPLPALGIYPVMRVVQYSDFGSRFTGAFGLNYETPLSGLHLRGQASANFNPPTFNDLYWAQGGNEDLKPEESITLEAGLSYEQRVGRGRVRSSFTAYDIRFEQGIRWIPGNNGIWSPVNIDEIRSRGIEAETQARLPWRRWEWSSAAVLSYTRAESEQAGGEWKQIAYVPEWNWKLSGGLHRNPGFLRLSWQKSSRRYTTNDHSSPLDPLDAYATLTAQAGVDFRYQQTGFRFSYTLHNVTDTDYEVIARYPMPPRYHSLSLSISIGYD